MGYTHFISYEEEYRDARTTSKSTLFTTKVRIDDLEFVKEKLKKLSKGNVTGIKLLTLTLLYEPYVETKKQYIE